ncbi:hypothetical protein [Pandoraea norimbergensis]
MKETVESKGKGSHETARAGGRPTGSPSALVADLRPSSAAHSQLRQLIDGSARGAPGRTLAGLIDGSSRTAAQRRSVAPRPVAATTNEPIVQRVIKIAEDEYTTYGGKDTTSLVEEVDADDRSESWKRGWKSHIREMAAEKDGSYDYGNLEAFIVALGEEYEKEGGDELSRPTFPKRAYTLAKGTASVQSGKDMSDISLSDNDLALPHRMPFADIRRSVVLFATGLETPSDLIRWTDRLVTATEQRKEINLKADVKGLLPKGYEEMVDEQIAEFEAERARVVKIWEAPKSKKDVALVRTLLAKANSLHGNIPDLGSHSTNNIRVSDRLHARFVDNQMSPGTKAAFAMSPGRIGKGVATTKDKKGIVTVDNRSVPVSQVNTHHELSATQIPSSDLKPLKLKFSIDTTDGSKDESEDDSGDDLDDMPELVSGDESETD